MRQTIEIWLLLRFLYDLQFSLALKNELGADDTLGFKTAWSTKKLWVSRTDLAGDYAIRNLIKSRPKDGSELQIPVDSTLKSTYKIQALISCAIDDDYLEEEGFMIRLNSSGSKFRTVDGLLKKLIEDHRGTVVALVSVLGFVTALVYRGREIAAFINLFAHGFFR